MSVRPIHGTKRVICILATIAVALWFSLAPGETAQEVAKEPTAARGIAVLASCIGNEYPVDALVQFVERGHFSPVVIDWAWITFHWDKTDFSAVNALVDALSSRGIPFAAMYRPRFIGDPTVPVQIRPGAEETGRYEICYSSPEARRWGIQWGERILQRCPRFDEIIVYNPINTCQCPQCVAAAAESAAGRFGVVWEFLAEANM